MAPTRATDGSGVLPCTPPLAGVRGMWSTNCCVWARATTPVTPGETRPSFWPCAPGGSRTSRRCWQKSPDLNAPDQNGQTPLLEAVARDDAPMVKALLQAGADHNGRDLGNAPR